MLDTYRTTALAPGHLGTFATLIAMADMVRRDSNARGVRAKAVELTQDISGHDPEQQVRALFTYARDKIRYLRDPLDVEWVQGNSDGFEGVRTLDVEHGDCDDKVVLLGSLLGSIGIKSRFVIISYDGNQWNHVYLEARLPNRWIALDPTDPHAHPGDEQWRVSRQTYDIWTDLGGVGQTLTQDFACGPTCLHQPCTVEVGGDGKLLYCPVDSPPATSDNPAKQYFPGATPNDRLDRICNDPTLACVGGGGRYVKCLAAGYNPPCLPASVSPSGVPGATSLQPPSVMSATGIPWWVWAGGVAIVLVSLR